MAPKQTGAEGTWEADMSFLKRIGRSAEGFTLVEMTVVIAIIAVLAALALPAVTGVTTDTRSSAKVADQKQVETAVTRFDDANSAFPILDADPTTAAVTASAGVLKIVVVSSTDSGSNAFPTGSGVLTCGTTSLTATASLDACFGDIDFAGDLVPTFIKVAPKHPTDLVVNDLGGDITGGSTKDVADATFDNCNLAGDTCEFYLESGDNLSASDLNVWVIDSSKAVFTFKSDAKYGQ
ncbi:MAG: prepilin-type N-terminal cleavage/methylation domain-containing protein [Dehalococcoidia bacterium]